MRHHGKAWAWETGLENNVIRQIIILPQFSRKEIERTRAHYESTYGPVKIRRVLQYIIK